MKRAVVLAIVLMMGEVDRVALGAAAVFAQTLGQAPRPRGRLFQPQDLGLLDSPDREQWNKPDVIMDALKISDSAMVAEIGAGGGWFPIRLARRVGPNGVVYAQDIQPQMLEAIGRRMQHEGLTNVRTVLGTTDDPSLPGGLDAVLMVDAYGEFENPITLLRNVRRSLKPTACVGVVEYLPGGGGPGPAREERVDADSVIRSAEAAGLTLQFRQNIPPFMFLLVFGTPSSRCKAP